MLGDFSGLMKRFRAALQAMREHMRAALNHPACAWIFRHLHNRRRSVAVTGSILLHVLALLFLLLPEIRTGGMSAGGGVGDGMGVGEGIELTLYDVGEAQRLPEIKPPDPEDLEELTELDVAQISEIALTDPANLTFSDLAIPSVTESAATTPSSSQSDLAANQGAAGTGGLTRGEGDDLWAAIAPCWRKVLDSNTVPVTLEVTFSPSGQLAAPPLILRGDASASDPRQLVSESKAIQALAECGAYPMAAGESRVSINFTTLQ